MKLLPIKRVVAMIYCTVCSICVFTPWIASADCSNAPPQRIVVFSLYAEEIIYGLVEPERIIYVGHQAHRDAGRRSWLIAENRVHVKGFASGFAALDALSVLCY